MYLLKKISKSFGSGSNKETALSSISLVFPSKGLVFIKGESGSGKSTLLNILGFLLTPNYGKLFFNGKDVSKLSSKEKENIRLNQIGFVFQHFNLIEELTVSENLLLFENDKERALKVLSKLGIKDFANKSVSKLSGGEKQRVGIARALMKSPLVLLCDEPTGALDEENSLKVKSILESLSKDILVIAVSHEKRLFNNANYYLELERGHVKETNLPLTNSLPKTFKKRKFKGNLNPFRKLLSKKNKVKSMICFFSFCLMEVVFSCGLGFKKGAEQINDSIMENSFDSLFLTVSKKEKVSASSSLNLVRESKPSKSDLSFLGKRVDVYSSFSFALPYSESFYINDAKQTPTGFSPYFPTDLLTFDKYNLSDFILTKNMMVFVNDSFLSFYKDVRVGDTIKIKRNLTFEFENGKDEIDLVMNFNIASSLKEFSFLNSPRVYFPYDEVAGLLDGVILPNYSLLREKNMSILDFIINSSSESIYSGRESLLHCRSLEDAGSVFGIINEFSKEDTPLSFSSRVYLTKDSYSSLSSLICLCLELFSIFELALCIVLLLLDCFYCYLRNKKYCAIFLCFGLGKARVISLFSFNSFLIFLFSLLAFMPLSLLSFKAINTFLAPNLGFESIIANSLFSFNGIPFFIPLIFAMASIFIYLFTFLLLYLLLSKVDIAKELKDE